MDVHEVRAPGARGELVGGRKNSGRVGPDGRGGAAGGDSLSPMEVQAEWLRRGLRRGAAVPLQIEICSGIMPPFQSHGAALATPER